MLSKIEAQTPDAPFVLRGGKPMIITSPGGEEGANKMSGDRMPEDLSVNMPSSAMASPPTPIVPVVSVTPAPTQSELDAEQEDALAAQEDAQYKAAEQAAEAQGRMEDATKRVARRRDAEADRDDMFRVSKEDIMGGSEDDIDDVTGMSEDDLDDAVGVDNSDIMGQDDNDFSDLLEVSQEDVLGRPPAQKPPRRMTRRLGYNPSPPTSLGGMVQ